MTPAETSRSKLGISAASRSGWMIFQSAASQPSKSTFFARRSDMTDNLHNRSRSRMQATSHGGYGSSARRCTAPASNGLDSGWFPLRSELTRANEAAAIERTPARAAASRSRRQEHRAPITIEGGL